MRRAEPQAAARALVECHLPRAACAIAVSAVVLLVVASCGGADHGSDLKGVPWQWSGVLIGEDTIGLSPIPDPANYLLRLDDDGTFIARADCKSVAGTYSLSGSDLTLELTPPPRNVCGKDSRADQYVALLQRVATYDLPEQSSLALGLKEDAGYLYFYAPAQ